VLEQPSRIYVVFIPCLASVYRRRRRNTFCGPWLRDWARRLGDAADSPSDPAYLLRTLPAALSHSDLGRQAHRPVTAEISRSGDAASKPASILSQVWQVARDKGW